MTPLKHYRESAGLTQVKLAKKLGATNGQYVSNVERGKCFLSPKQFARASKALKVPVKTLINDHMDAYRARLEKQLKVGRG